MKKNRFIKFTALARAAVTLAIGLLLPIPSVAAQAMVRLKNHVPSQIQRASMLSRTASDELIQISLVVHVDQSLLDQEIEHLYGRHAPARKHFLSSMEFAQRFGLTEKRQALKEFAIAQGLAVVATPDRPESMIVAVSGTAAAVERAFHVQMNHYRGADGKMFRANDSDPAIPEAIADHLGAVVGLSDNKDVLKPHLAFPAARTGAQPQLTGTSGVTAGSLAPSDIKTIYGLNSTTLTGSGQTLALFELDGYDPTDITAYEIQYGLSAPTVVPISVDGSPNLCSGAPCVHTVSPSGNVVEVMLDIQMAIALAPGLSRLLVYEAANSFQGITQMYDRIASDNLASVISTSWGLDEQSQNSLLLASETQSFQRMAIQGQTLFAASGDSGAFDHGGNSSVGVDDPASQPFVTGVGGTVLTGSVLNPTETVWNNGYNSLSGFYSGGGGGVSVLWPIPSYQVGVPGLASQTARNVPDVSLNADPSSGYSMYVAGNWYKVGGTSAAAPLWAAMTSLMNQQRIAMGNGNLGFANPALYELGTSTSASVVYRDITSGNNGFYSAGSGYDNASGWGPFRGSAFISTASELPSLFILESLSNVYAYPNPWDIRRNSRRQVTVTNIPNGAIVKIFTLSGFWVTTLPTAVGGSATWDLTTNSGERVASGLYYYVVTTAANSAKGEIAIIK